MVPLSVLTILFDLSDQSLHHCGTLDADASCENRVQLDAEFAIVVLVALIFLGIAIYLVRGRGKELVGSDARLGIFVCVSPHARVDCARSHSGA